MKSGAIIALVGDNLKRNKLFAITSVLSIALGILLFVFFIGLGEGVKAYVVERFFDAMPETRLKVTTQRIDLGLFNIAKPKFLKGSKIDDALIETIKKKPGVVEVFSEMNIEFPIRVTGALFGRRAASDLIGTGIDPKVVKDDLASPDAFRYRKGKPVPVIVSRRLLELYNASFAPMNGFPQINEKSIQGFRFDLVLGQSGLGGVAEHGEVRTVQCELVGFSNKAVTIGITVPIDYVKKWNETYAKKGDAYHALYADVKRPEHVETLSAWLEEKGYAVQTAKEGATKKANDAIALLVGIFVTLSVVILIMSALSMMLQQFYITSKRKKEFGLWRSLGAKKKDIASIIVFEALALGLAGGFMGALGGYLLAISFEDFLLNVSAAKLFAPEALFLFPLWLWLIAPLLAIAFSLFGAIAPAWQAANQSPIRALKEQ